MLVLTWHVDRSSREIYIPAIHSHLRRGSGPHRHHHRPCPRLVPRRIQLALQNSGTTPRELIKEKRLRLAYLRRRNPAYRRWSISAIAPGLGFDSASAFSTAFRQRFNARPRDIRQG
ncbi:helix-turn-helix domain-containing protein [Nocardia sp. NPDC049737]|uniref:helix-turn-helix domain-containing protein n=1 Tax=Nocardia sp. NPDC049737 TaxID=3154358 RepID=UPI0034124DFE